MATFRRECSVAKRSYWAANCEMSQLMLRDATKSPELFEKSMKVYLNLAERASAEPVEGPLPHHLKVAMYTKALPKGHNSTKC